MRQNKISTVVLFTTIAAWAGSVTASPVGTNYNLTMTNLPVDISLMDVEFDPDETDFSAGGGGVISEVAGTNNNQDFVEFWIEWFDAMVPDDDVPGGIEIEGLDAGSNERIVENSGFIYFTIDGTPQSMADTGALNVELATHPMDSNIQVLLLKNPSVSTDAFGFSSSDFGATGMRSLMQGLGINDPDLINDLHVGFQVDDAPNNPQLPEPSTGLLFGMGALAMLQARRQTRRQRIAV